MLGEIAAIRLRDLEIFAEVARARSIREAARRIGSTSGQVSKSVQNLERLIGTKLFKRSVSGVLLTTQGAELQAIVQDLLNTGGRIESLLSGRGKGKIAKILAIAGTAFFNTHLTVPLVCRFAGEWPLANFRFLDLAPDQFVSVGLRGGFEIAVHYDSLSWPNTWTTKRIGKVRWVLCARAGHPLPKRPSAKQILEYPFVAPTYWTTEGLVSGNDDQFPIAMAKRKVGYETATAHAAVPIVLETDQLAFLPELLVRSLLRSRRFRDLKADGISLVEKEVFLSAKSDSVPAATFEGLARRLAEGL